MGLLRCVVGELKGRGWWRGGGGMVETSKPKLSGVVDLASPKTRCPPFRKHTFNSRPILTSSFQTLISWLKFPLLWSSSPWPRSGGDGGDGGCCTPPKSSPSPSPLAQFHFEPCTLQLSAFARLNIYLAPVLQCREHISLVLNSKRSEA